MNNKPEITFRLFLLPVLLLFFIGWGGLALLVLYTLPTVWPRWAFFVFWLMALTGTALPAVYYLNKRFPSDPPSEPNVIVRQALWVGVYGATLAWLQLGRVVNLYVTFGLAVGLMAIEYLIRMRERSRWRPPEPDLQNDQDDQD